MAAAPAGSLHESKTLIRPEWRSVASAAAFGAHAHGRAASLGLAEGLVAGDLPGLVAKWLSEQREPVSVEAAR